jgi:hypothetical protein
MLTFDLKSAWLDSLKANLNVEIFSPFDQTIYLINKSFAVLGMICCSFFGNYPYEHTVDCEHACCVHLMQHRQNAWTKSI